MTSLQVLQVHCKTSSKRVKSANETPAQTQSQTQTAGELQPLRDRVSECVRDMVYYALAATAKKKLPRGPWVMEAA